MKKNEGADKLAEFTREIESVQNKYGFKLQARLDFPQYKILPPEVKLAISVLTKNGAVLKIFAENIKKKQLPNENIEDIVEKGKNV